ncbi:MAG: hypothetical protein CMJ78_23640 [Planctomycetaceae bacterium]|nr:hypothetical protein [Planctomycetaceae bacterium]
MKFERVDADRIRQFSIGVFEAAGAPRGHAEKATDVLLWASLRGVDTHGIRNLKRYYLDASGVGRRDGEIDLKASLTLEKESATTASFNANSGLAIALSVDAMNCAIEKAKQSGVGVVTVHNSTHFGAAGHYAWMAVEHDMLGFASTGYFFPNGQLKSVLPFGGTLPMLSTNPLAIACPADKKPPFVLDMSTSIVPVNRIELREEQEQPIPSNWALDKNGQSTTNPDEVYSVNPLGNATTFGGHKGYGLAIVSWILTGLLSGAWKTDADRDRVLGDNPDPVHGYSQEGISHSFAALRLDQFGDPQFFRQGMDAMMQAINDSPPAAGFDDVRVPGQGAEATRQDRLENGIPINEATRASLMSLAEEYDVAF